MKGRLFFAFIFMCIFCVSNVQAQKGITKGFKYKVNVYGPHKMRRVDPRYLRVEIVPTYRTPMVERKERPLKSIKLNFPEPLKKGDVLKVGAFLSAGSFADKTSLLVKNPSVSIEYDELSDNVASFEIEADSLLPYGLKSINAILDMMINTNHILNKESINIKMLDARKKDKRSKPKKQLFNKGNDAEWGENFELFFKEYYPDIKIAKERDDIGVKLNSSSKNIINIVFLAFHKYWNDNGLVDMGNGPACYRFLHETCKIASDASESTYSDWIRDKNIVVKKDNEIIYYPNVDPEVYSKVCTFVESHGLIKK